MPPTALHLDTSARLEGSVTRDLTARIVRGLAPARVLRRDLARTPVPQIDADWVAANFTAPADRTAAQARTLALSDELVAELAAADTLVIGVPVYNFGAPAALKAWIDQVARAGLTFRYTADGPEGLLTGKRAILALASGGTRAGSDIDFATPYLRHVLGFLGITDVTVVAADRMALDGPASLEQAHAAIAGLKAAA
jgi:FMN-dependent NADH-azoreductase